MKAKTASLIAKGIAIAILLTSWVMIAFYGMNINIMSVVTIASAIALVFGDVSLNLALDKFRGKPDTTDAK
jgi:hypothetical protein